LLYGDGPLLVAAKLTLTPLGLTLEYVNVGVMPFDVGSVIVPPV
jgi:hypothetical protein